MELLASANHEWLFVEIELEPSLDLGVAERSFTTPKGADRETVVVVESRFWLAGHRGVATWGYDVDAFDFLSPQGRLDSGVVMGQR